MTAEVFECPKCGGPIRVEDSARKSVTCPFCNSTVIVPDALRLPVARLPAQVEMRPPTSAPAQTPPIRMAELPRESTPTTPGGRRRMPTWLIIVGGIAVLALGICLCLFLSTPLFRSPEDATKTNLIIDNQSGATVCRVELAVAGSNLEGVEQLGSSQVEDGATVRLTGINPGSYDISAYDCDGNVLADDKGVPLLAGNFTWIVSAH